MNIPIKTHLLVGLLFAGALNVGFAQDTNLLKNPDFEGSITLNIDRLYKEAANGVIQLPKGPMAAMPVGVWLNLRHGWMEVKKSAGFEYLTGQPGRQVHSGQHAIKVFSPELFVGVMVGGGPEVSRGGGPNLIRIAVRDVAGSDEQVVALNKPYRFSFFAKGIGEVMPLYYSYTSLECLPPSTPSYKTEPVVVKIDDENVWKQYEVVITVINPDVVAVQPTMVIKGEVSLDDLALQLVK